MTGCVKRAILIDSSPPGAEVWINETHVGKTPLEYEFITHGRYKFRLRKAGFKEQIAREMVRAPIHQWIPIDFITENLLPMEFDDTHHFLYALTPEPPRERMKIDPPTAAQDWAGKLNSADMARRREALMQLARIRDRNTISDVEPILKDPEPLVRGAALHAWRVLRGAESLGILLDALENDPKPQVRWQAAVELEALADPAAVPGLIEALQDREGLVRGGAAEALKGLLDPRSVDPLVKALRDKDAVVRRASAEALGLIGERSAVAGLTRALFHRDVVLRREAVEALFKIKDPSASRALVKTFTDWDPSIRSQATDALIEFGDPEVVPLLIRYLRGWKTWTRAHAARVLGGMKEPTALEPIQKALVREPDPTTRAIMTGAIQDIEG